MNLLIRSCERDCVTSLELAKRDIIPFSSFMMKVANSSKLSIKRKAEQDFLNSLP